MNEGEICGLALIYLMRLYFSISGKFFEYVKAHLPYTYVGSFVSLAMGEDIL